ncbi:hypothetical protein AA0120_g5694 [Alternaria tenuissima]|nr:hypothetical protein AA0120_g5694 [Alternaria tenuissima]
MGDIYSKASLVLIWLGPAASVDPSLFRFFHEFEGLRSMDQETQAFLSTQLYRALQASDLLESLIAVYQRSWFQRIWTLQEVALAKDSLVICGDSKISWSLLVYAIDQLRVAENSIGVYGNFSVFDSAISAHQIMVQCLLPGPQISSAMNPNPDRPVTQLLVMSLRRRATEPKDHIFGLYSILQRLGTNLPPPDYERDINQIFTEAARLAIEKDNSLWILDFIDGIEERQHWPSWVPTWVTMMGPGPIEVNAFHPGAAGDSRPRYKFSEDSRRLTLRGKIVDKIMMKAERSPWFGVRYQLDWEDMLIPSLQQRENSIKAFQEWITFFHAFKMMARNTPANRYGDDSQHIIAFIRVLLQDFTVVPDSLRNVHELLRGFSNWQLYLSATNPGSSMPMPQLMARLEPPSYDPSSLPDWLSDLTQTNEWNIYEAIQQDPSAALFHTHVALGTRAKLFFVTENGYYGTTSATIECNDYVVLVSGLQVPLIVRPIEGEAGHYKLLGPAFVNGMMSGELWPEADEDLMDLTIV